MELRLVIAVREALGEGLSVEDESEVVRSAEARRGRLVMDLCCLGSEVLVVVRGGRVLSLRE